MEQVFCRDLDYRLFLTGEDYRTFYYMLKDIWLRMRLDDAMRVALLPEVPDIAAKDRWGTRYIFCGLQAPPGPDCADSSIVADVKQRAAA